MGSYEQAGYSLGYVDPTDNGNKNLIQMMGQFYESNYRTNSVWQLNGSIDKRFKVSEPMLYESLYGQSYQNYTKFQLNMIMRLENMLTGYQRRNRKSTVTVPIHENDDSLADEYNAVIKYVDERDGFQEYFSQGFEGACDTGLNLLHCYLDYSQDAISGDLYTDDVGFSNFIIDANFRKMDLSDCGGIWRRRWVGKETSKLLLPGYEKEIDKMKPPGGSPDGKFPYQAELMNLNLQQLYPYDEFYYRDTREAKMIIDPYSNEMVEWEDQEGDQEHMMERTLQLQPWLIVKKMQVPTVKLIIKLGNNVVYHGKNLLSIDAYPMVPMMYYHDPDIRNPAWRVFGFIRLLKDAQFLYNMRKVIELQMLQSSINAGWIFPVDVVTDPKAFRQSSGGDGFLIPLKAGRTPAEIQRIEPVAIPGSLLELSRSLSEDIMKISGVTEELLGMSDENIAGVLGMMRQAAGITSLQNVFDKADYSQRLYGKIRLEAIRKNFSKSKVKKILGHEPDPRFFLNYSQKFSIAVEEGAYSTTQRHTELSQLLHFKQIGIPIPEKSIIRVASITNKKQLIQDLEEASQQQSQVQQMQMQSEQQKQQSELAQRMAKSRLDIASAQEKMARIEEIKSSAEQKQLEADLNLVKLAMSLEDVQFNQLKSAIELAEAMKVNQQQLQPIG